MKTDLQINPTDLQSSFFGSDLAEAIAVVVRRYAGIVHVPCLGASDDVVAQLRKMLPRVDVDVLRIGPQRQETLRFAPPD